MLKKLFDIKVTTGKISDAKRLSTCYQSTLGQTSGQSKTKFLHEGSDYELGGERIFDSGFLSELKSSPHLLCLNYKPVPFFIFTRLFGKKPKTCSRVALFTIDLSQKRQEANLIVHKGWTCLIRNDFALLVISIVAWCGLKFMLAIGGNSLNDAGQVLMPLFFLAAFQLFIESVTHLYLASQATKMMRQYFRDNKLLKQKTYVEIAKTNSGFSNNPNYPDARVYLGGS